MCRLASMDDKLAILLIEDETSLACALEAGLKEQGYTVSLASSGEEGIFSLLGLMPDIVLLDLGLPGRDGLEILAHVRKAYPHLPVLILTARDTVEDRVLGLDTGADDYLVKPFALAELLARVRALTRPSRQRRRSYQIGDLKVDSQLREVSRNGTKIDLTPKEFELLELLVANKGLIVSRQTIGREIWSASRATPLDNVIDVHIMRLRKKVDIFPQRPLIHTVRGMGFMIDDAETP